MYLKIVLILCPMWYFYHADKQKNLKMPPKASQLKKRNKKCNNTLLFWSAVPGYCIDRLQPFQCLIFVAVCHSVASFSTSVLHFSQSLHVGNVISQCFNKSNSLLVEISSLFLLSMYCYYCCHLYFLAHVSY